MIVVKNQDLQVVDNDQEVLFMVYLYILMYVLLCLEQQFGNFQRNISMKKFKDDRGQFGR